MNITIAATSIIEVITNDVISTNSAACIVMKFAEPYISLRMSTNSLILNTVEL